MTPTLVRATTCLLAAGLLVAQSAAAIPIAPPPSPNAALIHAAALERYQARADRHARDYDRTQDAAPEQLLALLDVAERTGYSLGQLLATGEHESAHTWNDYVRPPLSGGRVGVAAGVWQFQPRTFERVIHLYGDKLLQLTDADPALGRRRLDLGFGPFCDSHVRLVIRDTVEGLRGPDDQELQLLRHNFTVLAFAKYLLSRDSGAEDPVEDYLFHFLGPERGRRILTLATGDARNTRSVKPPPSPQPSSQPSRNPASAGLGDSLPGRPQLLMELAPKGYLSGAAGARPRPGARAADRMLQRPGEPPPAPLQPSASLLWQAPHGYPYDSPVVRGNLGMFYRDGAERGIPYTWAEFLEHLSRRVKADEQPKLVRAKYGVGFELDGGDMPRWASPAHKDSKMIQLHLGQGRRLDMPQARLTAPLDAAETHDYQRRLAALIELGEAEPTAVLSDAAASTIWHLGLFSTGAGDDEGAAHSLSYADLIAKLGTDMGPGWGTVLRTESAPVRDSLHAFRKLVGKSEPDDPAQADLLLPAERVALEIYGRRIEQFLLESEQAAADQAASAD